MKMILRVLGVQKSNSLTHSLTHPTQFLDVNQSHVHRHFCCKIETPEHPNTWSSGRRSPDRRGVISWWVDPQEGSHPNNLCVRRCREGGIGCYRVC